VTPAGDAAAAPRRIFLATPGFEAALIAEVPPARAPVALPELPGAVNAAEADDRTASHDGAPDPGEPNTGEGARAAAAPDGHEKDHRAAPPLDPVFARQQLPRATAIQAPSVARLAEAAYAAVEHAVDQTRGPFTLHAFAPTGADPALGSRARLIGDQTLELLRARRRRAARLFRPPAEAAAAFAETSLLVQILLAGRERAFVSAARPRALAAGSWDLAPWPGGLAPVADDRRPPSRAYRKLEEAYLWMGDAPAPGELCVDLGGAPGGWSYTALRRGARVIAVDRAPLAAPVRGHPALTVIEGNAFTYQPPGPVAWLLSDVICEPARTLALLEQWLARGWCEKLVVTVKFKGSAGYGVLADVRRLLERAGCPRFRIKHLHHNKNEVTVMAVTAAAAGAGARLSAAAASV
jgi:23S rRNA (cytidine2498-2'-O)-methyltransferase